MTEVKSVLSIRSLRNPECDKCNKRKAEVAIGCYEYPTDDIKTIFYCVDCFKEEFPNYSLRDNCLFCKDNFDCKVQDTIFTDKEIEIFKQEYNGVIPITEENDND